MVEALGRDDGISLCRNLSIGVGVAVESRIIAAGDLKPNLVVLEEDPARRP